MKTEEEVVADLIIGCRQNPTDILRAELSEWNKQVPLSKASGFSAIKRVIRLLRDEGYYAAEESSRVLQSGVFTESNRWVVCGKRNTGTTPITYIIE
jgi:hypothetical protein